MVNILKANTKFGDSITSSVLHAQKVIDIEISDQHTNNFVHTAIKCLAIP